MPEYKISSVPELEIVAAEVVSHIKEKPVVAIYGQMGAGKTTFIKVLCKLLGVKETVTSPTFAVINEYTGALNQKIYHFDFYRLKSIEEAVQIGFEDYLHSGEICLIEWPELIEKLLPDFSLKLHISVEENEMRTFTIS